MDDRNRPATGYPAPHPNGYASANPYTAGTAYPCGPPPPGSYNYYQNYPANSNPNPYYGQRNTFLRRLFAIIIAAFIITGAIIFIIWLVLRPRISEFRVDSLSISNFNLSNSLLSANWNLRLTAQNPNKKISLSYDDIRAGVFYKSSILSETTVPPFTQDTRSETALEVRFAATGAYVGNGVVDRLNGERNNGGSVGFNVRMTARVMFKAGAWRARRRSLSVYCGDLSVTMAGNGTNGSLVGGARQCRVGI